MLFIYIHGFNSSPQSYKAQCFARYLADNHPQAQFLAPQLSDYPRQALNTLFQVIEKYINSTSVALVGSSLGGFYATWLAEEYALKAVLVNPAVNPDELLLDYLGVNKNYHTDVEYEFTQMHIQQLQELVVADISKPEQLMVLLQSGDEVLDYRLAAEKYAATELLVEQGGEHSFQNFSRHCDTIYSFLK